MKQCCFGVALVPRLEAIPGALAPGAAASEPDPYLLPDIEWQHLVAPGSEHTHLPDNDPDKVLEPPVPEAGVETIEASRSLTQVRGL